MGMAKGDVTIFIALLLTAGLFWAADRLYPDLLLERLAPSPPSPLSTLSSGSAPRGC